jgi:hypothetical protein
LSSYCKENEQVIKKVNHSDINGYNIKDIIHSNLIKQIEKNLSSCFILNKLVLTELDFKNENNHNWFEIRYVPINT